MLTNRIAVIAALSLTSSAVQAELSLAANEEDLMLLYPDEEMVSIATGTAKPLHLAPSVASVVTAREIEAMGARSLDEVLETVPGLHVSLSSNRLNKIYSIRGIHTDYNPQVLFLLNGYVWSDPVTGTRPPLFRMGVANISRIEIILGPGSAVYGADAFSGVINVITKESAELEGTTVGGRAGSFASQDLWLQHGGQYGGWNTAFSFEYSRSHGDNGRRVGSDLQTIFDGLFGSSATLAPGPLSTGYTQLDTSLTVSRDNWKIWLNSWNLRDAGVGEGVAQALDPAGRQEVDQYTLNVNYRDKGFAPDLELEAKFNYDRIDQQAYFQLFPPGALLPVGNDGNAFTGNGIVLFSEGMRGNPGAKTNRATVEAAFNYTGLKGHLLRLALGANYLDAEGKETKNFGPGVIDGTTLGPTPTTIDGTLTSTTGTPYLFMPPSLQRVKYLSVQDEWAFAPDWELTAGIRYDNYSDFGATTNPRLALVWATDYNLTTKLLYGRAFRAPSFTELYFINNPSALGNPRLQPETIDMAELVFDYRPTLDLHTVLNLFRYQVKDLIDFAGGVAQNANDQSGHGFEVDIDWQLSKGLDLIANYAWQNSEDGNTGATIANAPGQQAYLRVRYKATEACSINPQANWIAKRKRASGDTRAAIADYTLVDLMMRCDVANWPLNVAAGVRNVFDQDAREPSPYNPGLATAPIPNDFPLEGRSLYLELSYRFRK